MGIGQRVVWNGKTYTIESMHNRGKDVMVWLWDGRRRKLRGPVPFDDLKAAG